MSLLSAGTPIPTHSQAFTAFSTFVRIRVSTGSHASWFLAAVGMCQVEKTARW